MSGQAWVQLALEKLGCSQKALAIHLGVSPAQISKWKNDEHMSFEMEDRFRDLTGIGQRHPEFVLWAQSLESAIKWEKLIVELASLASEGAETGYDTSPLEDEPELLCWTTFHTLRQMGIAIPAKFPVELNGIVNDEPDDDDFDRALENRYADLIFRIYKALNDVYGFFVAYISELTVDDQLDLFETGAEIESRLIDLAATKLDLLADFAPNFRNFRSETIRDYEKWLGIVKNTAFRSGVPLKAELLDLVHKDHDTLGHDAEAESLGFNESRLHPDIYMNELLVGMRTIHQVLPVILKKLQIDEKDFALDTSALRL
jgi:transcriptional regulator with XRE-family HTH domain